MKRGEARGRIAAAAIALLVIVAVVLFVRPGDGTSTRRAGDPEGEASAARAGHRPPKKSGARPAVDDGDPGAVDSFPSPSADPSGAPRGDDFMNAPNLPPAPPYPPGSQPLTEGVDPASQPREVVPADAKTGVSCSFGPRVAIVHPPDPLIIDAECTDKEGKLLSIANGVARFRPDRTTPDSGPWFSAPLVGRRASRGAIFTATYLPSAVEQAAFFKGGSHVFVEVAFDAPNGLGPRRYSTVMQYSRLPDAALSGAYTEQIVDGSLVISAGITVSVAGDYRLIGSLYGPGGDQAIAFAHANAHLDAGDGTIPLLFFGKILHDRGIDGPYELRYLMLFEHLEGAEEIPGETVDHAYTTKRYSAGDFSPQSYVAPAQQGEVVDMNSPSQQGKPPPLFSR